MKPCPKNDFEAIALVASRYLMTAAGFEAMQILSARAFDHNQPLEAALLCDAMLTHSAAQGEIRGPLSLRTAFAWHQAGQPARCLAVLKQLMILDSPSLWRFGGKQVRRYSMNGMPILGLQHTSVQRRSLSHRLSRNGN